MTNEAVIIELLGNGGDPVSMTCADSQGIEKGTLLWYYDPRTVSGSAISLGAQPFAGIAAQEKVASDGSTTISVYTNGIFDLTTVGGPATIIAGMPVALSGQNLVGACDVTTVSGSKIVGVALETASASEVIAVRVNGLRS